MMRHLLVVFAVLALCGSMIGCDKKPQKPQQPAPKETGAAEAAEEADTGAAEAETDTGAAEAEADTGAPEAEVDDEEPTACPKPRDYQGMCAQVITWAKNPDTGDCCQYGSPCETPKGWETFNSKEACEQGTAG